MAFHSYRENTTTWSKTWSRAQGSYLPTSIAMTANSVTERWEHMELPNKNEDALPRKGDEQQQPPKGNGKPPKKRPAGAPEEKRPKSAKGDKA